MRALLDGLVSVDEAAAALCQRGAVNSRTKRQRKMLYRSTMAMVGEHGVRAVIGP